MTGDTGITCFLEIGQQLFILGPAGALRACQHTDNNRVLDKLFGLV